MCAKYSEWVHAKFAKMKRVTTTLAKGFVCEKYIETIKELDKEIFFDQVEFVKSFCYLRNMLNASCEAAVTSRTRIEWIKF